MTSGRHESPSHHRRHVDRASDDSESPRLRLATPIVALTVVLMTPASTARPNTSAACRARADAAAHEQRRADHRLEGVADRDPGGGVQGTSVVALAARAPTKTAGHSRRPPSTNCRERDPGWRPDRSHARGRRRELQPQHRGGEAGHRHRRHPDSELELRAPCPHPCQRAVNVSRKRAYAPGSAPRLIVSVGRPPIKDLKRSYSRSTRLWRARSPAPACAGCAY